MKKVSVFGILLSVFCGSCLLVSCNSDDAVVDMPGSAQTDIGGYLTPLSMYITNGGMLLSMEDQALGMADVKTDSHNLPVIVDTFSYSLEYKTEPSQDELKNDIANALSYNPLICRKGYKITHTYREGTGNAKLPYVLILQGVCNY